MVRELSELFGRGGSWEETKKLDILFKGRNILRDLLAQDPDDMGDQSRHLADCWPTDCVNWAPRTLEVIRFSNCRHLAYTRSPPFAAHQTQHRSTRASSIPNYIMFRNVEFFQNIFIFRKTNYEGNFKGSDGVFGNISFVEMESSKLINHLTNMFTDGQATAV